MKRILSWMLVLCMVLSMVPATAFAATVASGTCGENLTWVLDSNGTLTISGSGEMNDTYNHTWEDYKDRIKIVIIENGATSISKYAFNDHRKLENVSIPNTVTSIGESAFRNCYSLKSVEIQGDLFEIEDYTFAYCSSLEEVILPNTVTIIGDRAFYECIKLKNINIPHSIARIEGWAFKKCEKLESIILGKEISVIDDYAFSGCISLSVIRFEGDAPYIYDHSFYRVKALGYYPDNNDTWTRDVLLNYGGKITWTKYSHEHDYKTVVTPPTCTEQGYTTYSCECGDTYRADYVNALGHNWMGATCTEPDICSRCGLTKGEPKGHDYEDGICTDCGEEDPNYDPTPDEPDEPDEPSKPGTEGLFRLKGANRYQTGMAIANEMKELMRVDKFNTVVVAYGEKFPDALTGSYLAAKYDAPILLTDEKSDTNVIAYIRENLVSGGRVFILGGEAAVSEAFESGVKALGFQVERLKGSDRYATNLAILNKAGVDADTEILIATGNNYADSLSASATGLPMLLVNKELTAEQKAFLEGTSKKFAILGGTAAVSEEIEAELATIGEVVRVKGTSRYETSIVIAQRYFGNASAAVLAYGEAFPDGLCGGPLATLIGAPLVLTHNDKLAAADAYIEGVDYGYVTGGTGRLTDATVQEIFDTTAEVIVK